MVEQAVPLFILLKRSSVTFKLTFLYTVTGTKMRPPQTRMKSKPCVKCSSLELLCGIVQSALSVLKECLEMCGDAASMHCNYRMPDLIESAGAY